MDGEREDSTTTPQLETVIKGMLRPDVLIDLIRHFTVFEPTRYEDPKTGVVTVRSEKKIAAYHQYHAVKKAVQSTIRASHGEKRVTLLVEEEPQKYGLPGVKDQPKGDRKGGRCVAHAGQRKIPLHGLLCRNACCKSGNGKPHNPCDYRPQRP